MVTETDAERRHAARLLAARLNQALGAQVLVLDDASAVLAAAPDTPAPMTAAAAETECWPARVAAKLAGEPVQVLIGRTPHGGPLAVEHARAIVDLAVEQVAMAGGIPSHDELTNRLLLELVRGRMDNTEVLRSAQLLGMELHRPRAVILIDASDFILRVDGPVSDVNPRASRSLARARRMIGALARFFGAGSETIAGYIGDGEVVVLKERDDQRAELPAAPDAEPSWDGLISLKRTADDLLGLLRRETGAAVAIGVGRYHPGLAGLARSYEDAAAAIRVGRRFDARDHAYALDSLGAEGLIGGGDEATRASLAARWLAPLQREPELLETLETYFAEDCQPTAAAARLSVHRNTLGYRLEKVAALTGLDPRRFSDAVVLRLAVVLRALRNDPISLCRRPMAGPGQPANLAPRPMNGTVTIS